MRSMAAGVLFVLWLAILCTAQRSTPGAQRSSGGLHEAEPMPSLPPVGTQPKVRHADEDKPIDFTSSSILVLVPVNVTDKSGARVPKLSKEDFSILENGREQKIASFEEVVSSPERSSVPKLPDGAFTNVLSSNSRPTHVTVIALDTVNTPFLDQTWARAQIVKYLANAVEANEPTALVVISSRGMRMVHDFTTDTAVLIKALKTISGELPKMASTDQEALEASIPGPSAVAAGGIRPGTLGTSGPDPTSGLLDFVNNADITFATYQQTVAIQTTISAFLDVAWYLRGVPGKKSLVWVTGSFPVLLDDPAAVPNGDLATVYERAFQQLNSANISIYPVDARGLVSYSPIGSGNVRTIGQANQLMYARSVLFSSSTQSLNEVAAMTGGRAFYNTNDLAGSVKRAVADSQSYYMLTYYLDMHDTRPGWRKLKVHVNRKDVEVRARSGFFVSNATVNPEAMRQSDMAYAVSSPFNVTALPMYVQWIGNKPDKNKRKVEFRLQIPPAHLAISPEENSVSLDIAAVASVGTVAASQVGQRVQAKLKPEGLAQIRDNGFAYQGALSLDPGQYSVRFVIRDNLSGDIGSVTAPLVVQ